jgi:hypothetical protein
VSSGASLAVTAAAYSAIGGLPPRAVGEDMALTEALDRAGFKVRHSMNVFVYTSCRFEGRASGGAADTMRHRHAVVDAPCDDNVEPALRATRRAMYRRKLRERWLKGPAAQAWPATLGYSAEIADLFDGTRACSFQDAWDAVCRYSPALQPSTPLRPSELPRQIAIATLILRQLRAPAPSRKIAPAGRSNREGSTGSAMPA